MPRFAPALAAATFGLAVGIAAVGFDYAEGLSYLSTDPRACANCHIMQSQYDSWQKGSHHAVATCADCHLPHDFVGKYVAKSVNGWNHSSAFTLQNFPEPIMITPKNAEILQASCEHCHAGMMHDISAASGAPRCVGCHVSVGHGEKVGLGGPWRDEEIGDGSRLRKAEQGRDPDSRSEVGLAARQLAAPVPDSRTMPAHKGTGHEH